MTSDRRADKCFNFQYDKTDGFKHSKGCSIWLYVICLMTKKVHDSDEDVLKEAANMKSVQGGVSAETARRLKYISLITLTGQNAILGLSMRYSRTRDGDLFYEATAVLMAEVVRKL